MESDDENFVLVYNGEIFNHLEIRQNLEGKGHIFRGRSDTETVLRAFQAYGPACVKQFKGMFAFAVFDRRSRKVFIARDRFGIKPLYVLERHDGLAFASEAKALLPLIEGGSKPDWSTLALFMVMGYCPTPFSPFEGISKVPTGHSGWSEGSAPDWKAFQSLSFGNHPLTSVNEAVNHIKFLVEQAVNRQLMADVPVGLFLSGGLDSGLIALMAARNSKARLTAFTLQFSEPTHDESADAKRLARHIGVDWEESSVKPTISLK